MKDKSQSTVKASLRRSETGMFGWEQDIPGIWMSHFNNELLRMGAISKEEHAKMQRRIQPPKLLNIDEFRGKMIKS